MQLSSACDYIKSITCGDLFLQRDLKRFVKPLLVQGPKNGISILLGPTSNMATLVEHLRKLSSNHFREISTFSELCDEQFFEPCDEILLYYVTGEINCGLFKELCHSRRTIMCFEQLPMIGDGQSEMIGNSSQRQIDFRNASLNLRAERGLIDCFIFPDPRECPTQFQLDLLELSKLRTWFYS